MSRPREYLRLDEWQRWLNNDWKHVTNKLSRHDGMLYLLIGLVLIILARTFEVI